MARLSVFGDGIAAMGRELLDNETDRTVLPEDVMESAGDGEVLRKQEIS